MPTPHHHLQNLGGMLSSTGDRIAFAVAGVAGSAPIWKDWAKEISDVAATMGPTLAAAFVGSRIVLTWVQIWKAARSSKRE